MAIVKANAYGHGSVEIAKSVERANVDYLGVASLGEALELRSATIRTPILILSETPHAYLEHIIQGNITQAVYSLEMAKLLSDMAKLKNCEARVHVKIDTGMGRVGIPVTNALSLIRNIASLPNLYLEGIFTHFSKADEKTSDFTMKQFSQFIAVVKAVRFEGIDIPIVHAANSAAVLQFPQTHLDMVRVGLCMYGLSPCQDNCAKINLKPVLTLKTRVGYMKELPANTPIGYGSTFFTKFRTNIATLPVGYADGLSRSLSNRGSILIRGKRYPIVGTVTMDMITVDVGRDDIQVGDEAVLMGNQAGEVITANDLARIEQTISYEVLCGIGQRVARVYLSSSSP